jgi:phospholipid/cholesterol/gamma-HCH transport system ATP-binding protein
VELIRSSHALYRPTLLIVSHDLSLLWGLCQRVAVLGERKVLALGTKAEMAQNPHPIVQAYFQ